jgi:hypothetical protein
VSDQSWDEAIEHHYSTNWPGAFQRSRWDRGPVHELPDAFRVLVFNRTPRMVAYATRCMSQPHDEDRLELHLLSAPPPTEPSPELVELLTVVAHFHRTGSRLGPGHTVSFGRPWLPGSSCAHGLVSLPYLDGPELEWLQHPRVRFLWLIPITVAELQFKKTHGLEALEERFEAKPFDYLDPRRPSVV